MTKQEYLDLLTDKKERINHMHQVINKMKENGELSITNRQYEVLIRGYIVLIYSFWESSFTSLGKCLITIYNDIKLEDFTFKMKDKIFIKYLKEKSNHIGNHNWLESNYNSYQVLLSKTLKETNFEYHFYSNSNNPKLCDLESFLGLFHKRISISENTEKLISYIINSRNDIAHSGSLTQDYELDIKINFNATIDTIDILQGATNEIYNLFKNVIDKF